MDRRTFLEGAVLIPSIGTFLVKNPSTVKPTTALALPDNNVLLATNEPLVPVEMSEPDQVHILDMVLSAWDVDLSRKPIYDYLYAYEEASFILSPTQVTIRGVGEGIVHSTNTVKYHGSQASRLRVHIELPNKMLKETRLDAKGISGYRG